MTLCPAQLARPLQRAATLGFAALLCIMPARHVAAADAAVADLSEAVLEVQLNEQSGGAMLVVLRNPAGALWIEESDLARLRLMMPGTEPYVYEGRRYYALAAINGVKVRIDEGMQRAIVEAPAEAFVATRLTPAPGTPMPVTPASPGAFLNYQLSDQRIDAANLAGAYSELGVFGAPGVLTNTAVWRSYGGDSAVVRLDTAFTHDFAARMERLILGDSIRNAGSWGNAIRMGGIHWGTEYGIRPDLVTTPTLSTTGAAVVPSTVDVFVNNQKILSQDLQPGPFIIDRLPAVSGAGDVSVVVRDALGREQVVTQSFYSSNALLRSQLTQYSFDLGVIRENYATDSTSYGHLTGSALYRRGLNDRMTLEAHGEFLVDGAHATGLALSSALGQFGVLNLTAAAGGDGTTSGWLGGVGFERRGERATLLASSFFASQGYRQVGDAELAVSRFRQRQLLQGGVNLGRAGTLTLAWARATYDTQPAQRTFSLTHSLQLRNRGSLSLSWTDVRGATHASSVNLLFTLPLGERSSATFSGTSGQGTGAASDEVMAGYQMNAPVGPGYGYRVSASSEGNYDAGGRAQWHGGDLQAEAARNAGVSGQSLIWNGAATLLGGELTAARTVNGSFAVVDLGGLADVPVYVDHHLVAHTDAAGYALLPNLRSYEANRINIDPLELPLDTQIDARTLVVAPAWRSGVVARFPVERVQGGTFRLIRSDGRPVPAGAEVVLKGKVFPVALEGLTYVTGFDHGMGGRAQWSGGQCEFRLEPPPAGDPLPDMGQVPCYDSGAPAGT
ncbi:MAG: fimbria/pilus outer membrane usher protein [Steroidobacteraceae bacterium]